MFIRRRMKHGIWCQTLKQLFNTRLIGDRPKIAVSSTEDVSGAFLMQLLQNSIQRIFTMIEQDQLLWFVQRFDGKATAD